jgi:hypothetical protein
MCGLPFPKYGINVKSIVLQSKFLRMKKLLMVMTVVGFVACNNSSETTTPAADSATKTVEAVADTAKAKIDSAVKTVDSAAKAAVDSVKK